MLVQKKYNRNLKECIIFQMTCQGYGQLKTSGGGGGGGDVTSTLHSATLSAPLTLDQKCYFCTVIKWATCYHLLAFFSDPKFLHAISRQARTITTHRQINSDYIASFSTAFTLYMIYLTRIFFVKRPSIFISIFSLKAHLFTIKVKTVNNHHVIFFFYLLR